MKRKTKAEREQAERKALFIRVRDVYSGALGLEWGANEFASAEVLSRVVPALRQIFDGNIETLHHVFQPYNLHRFDNAKSAAEFLFDAGYRA